MKNLLTRSFALVRPVPGMRTAALPVSARAAQSCLRRRISSSSTTTALPFSSSPHAQQQSRRLAGVAMEAQQVQGVDFQAAQEARQERDMARFASIEGPLSEREIASFDRDGFVRTSSFFDPTGVVQLRQYIDELQKWPETPMKWMQYFEPDENGARKLCRTEYFLDYFPELRDLIVPPMQRAVSQVLREPAAVYKEKVNYKFANGGPFPPHQDSPAYVTFGQRFHVTVMIAVDDADSENGALDFVPGVHRELTILPHDDAGVIHQELLDEYERDGKWVQTPARAGDAVIFHSYSPHRSGPNRTDRDRRAIFVTFNARSDGGEVRERYYSMKREMFPPDIDKVEGKDYSEGAKVFNVATPIRPM